MGVKIREHWPSMIIRFRSLASSGLALLLAVVMTIAAPGSSRAGESGILHVGERTTLTFDGGWWAFDASESKGAQLVSVHNAGVQGDEQTFFLRGVKPGLAVLVFRNGKTTRRISVDVLQNR
jgi:hypothetical protein